MGASTYTHKFGPNSLISDRLNDCESELPGNHPLRCDQTVVEGSDSAETWASARSKHRNGVVAAFADGSARFFADDIHLPIWRVLAIRSGNTIG